MFNLEIVGKQILKLCDQGIRKTVKICRKILKTRRFLKNENTENYEVALFTVRLLLTKHFGNNWFVALLRICCWYL